MEIVCFFLLLFVYVTTVYGNSLLFLIVVCIRDNRTKLLASVGLAQGRPNKSLIPTLDKHSLIMLAYCNGPKIGITFQEAPFPYQYVMSIITHCYSKFEKFT